MGDSTITWQARLRSALRSAKTERIILYVVVPILLICSVFLPPFSLATRLLHTNLPQITPKGGTIGQAGSAQLAVAPGALKGNIRLQLATLASSERWAQTTLKSLPADVDLRSEVYRLSLYGGQPQSATFSLPVPAGVTNPDALDVVAWTGKAWEWVPSQTKSGVLEAQLDSLPLALAAVEGKAKGVAVAICAADMAAVTTAPLDVASEVYIAGLTLLEDGTVQGQVKLDSAPSNLIVLPSLSNVVKGVARTDWVANLVANAPTRTAHVKAIVEAVNKGGYQGLDLEYTGLDAQLRAPFSAFVSELAAALHKDGKILAVRVDEPQMTGQGGPSADGYDWVALGAAADYVRIPAPDDPAVYASGGAIEQILRAATAQIDRRKVQLVVSASCYDQAGGKQQAVCYRDALSLASQNLVAEGGEVVLPGQKVSVQVPSLATALNGESASGYLSFTYKDAAGVQHKVWLETAASVARKLALASQFSLRGVAVEQLAGTANDAGIWDVVRTARAATSREQVLAASSRGGARYSVVWKVQDKAGAVVQQGSSSGDQSAFSWTAVETPGDYVITVAISDDGGKTTQGQPGAVAVKVPSPTPSPTPMPTATPKPTATPVPAASQQQQAAPPPAPAPSSGQGFGYGIQVDMVTDTNYDRILGHVQALGFGWIKQQIEWFRFNSGPGQYDWGRMDAIADACSARGIKVMFSVVKAPNWARPNGDDRSVAGPPADPGTYAEFMRQMAARYKGRVQAYEIWNEQNLWYEWGGRGNRLSAARYVELLRAAYTAIKSVDPSATVISGALTPTGWSDGDTAIDDQVYLRQMYDAGLASYCDAVGAHPSGYNNPPDADWRTWSDPSANGRAKGHPSWYFRGTMEGYRNIMIAYGDGGKRIWPTEFGWGTTEGFGCAPAAGYEYEVDNNLAEQAAYIVRAYEMGRNWGFVGPMFLWNLNFATINSVNDEKSAFGIVGPGWSRRPAFDALANMPK